MTSTAQVDHHVDHPIDHPIAGRRILIVGGAGFIGHHMALRFKAQGADVHVLDGLQVNHLLAHSGDLANASRDLYVRFLNERLDLLRRADVPLHVDDARDYHRLSHVVASVRPQVVVHLAAVSHAGWANKNPFNTFDHSMRTLENALDASRDQIEHFVFFSSSMAYGNFPSETVAETTPCNPLGIYGALKLGGEHLVRAYEQVFGLPCTIIRPSALYGERCVSRRVIQVFIERALRGETLQVTGEGLDRLDFTYVGDVVAGIAKVIEHDAARGQTFNLTYGRSRSLNEVVDILRSRFPSVAVEHVPTDRLMPERGTLDVSKARALIGYEPAYPIEIGVARYIDWYVETLGAAVPTPRRATAA